MNFKINDIVKVKNTYYHQELRNKIGKVLDNSDDRITIEFDSVIYSEDGSLLTHDGNLNDGKLTRRFFSDDIIELVKNLIQKKEIKNKSFNLRNW